MISRFLKQTVSITPKASFDKWGNPVAGTAVSADARVQAVEDRIQTAPDTFVEVSLAVWLDGSASISNDDTLTFDSSAHRVVKVKNLYDISGDLEHIKVYCI